MKQPRRRARPASTLVLLLVLLAGGCGRTSKPQVDWPLGFHLAVDPAFKSSCTLRPSGEGTLYFLRGDEPDEPRLVVRKRQLRLSLEAALEEESALGMGPLVLEEGETFRVQAVNAVGLGLRRRVQPFPQVDSTLVLLYDTRIFAVGNFSCAFTWQQVPGDSASLATYESWMKHLRFNIADADTFKAAADTTGRP